jgi:hypothetical protein
MAKNGCLCTMVDSAVTLHNRRVKYILANESRLQPYLRFCQS